MSILQNYKNQNKDFKTLDLGGLLFLINDSNDELGQHYENKIIINSPSLSDHISRRYLRLKKLNINYMFVIVPDKSVVLSDYLSKYPGFSQCNRPNVDQIKEMSFVIDPLERIKTLGQEQGYVLSYPGDSHLNMLAIYALYQQVIENMKLTPYQYILKTIPSNQRFGDLINPTNNGNRKTSCQIWDIPIVKQQADFELINYQINLHTRAKVRLSFLEILKEKRKGGRSLDEYIDIYENEKCENNLNVFIFHDSHIGFIHGNKSIHKQWFACHFKTTYFLWSPFDSKILSDFKVDSVIDITTERFLNNYRLKNIFTTDCSNFDEDYYRKTYEDINNAILANKLKNCLQHYKNNGFREGRYPNSYFENEVQNGEPNKIDAVVDEDYYLNSYPFIRSFLANIPGHSVKEFYRIYGRRMGHNPSRQELAEALKKELEKESEKALEKELGGDTSDTSDFGFVIGRCIRTNEHQNLCKRCYNSIRALYPMVKIVIVDDNSIMQDPNTYDENTQVLTSTYRGSGEYGLYYEFWNLKPFSIAVILHDSMIVRKKFLLKMTSPPVVNLVPTTPTSSSLPIIDDVTFIWDFPCKMCDAIVPLEATEMINFLTNNDALKKMYSSDIWKGCFGVSSIIKWEYVDHLQQKYSLWNLCSLSWTRHKRESFERVFAVICYEDKSQVRTLIGDIFNHPHSFAPYDIEKIKVDYPIIKTWVGR